MPGARTQEHQTHQRAGERDRSADPANYRRHSDQPQRPMYAGEADDRACAARRGNGDHPRHDAAKPRPGVRRERGIVQSGGALIHGFANDAQT
ncbi:hypothetical protein WR25_08060 [Diploscapter pachys]|uniref:Uncharacterized protein n=1 Tax=Diploscapter pachys TaxID=2018661 RepID=A0A2A2KBX5_9BILA|nr:hypothetical protein WR25_08060 [Diploscapter pachys]